MSKKQKTKNSKKYQFTELVAQELLDPENPEMKAMLDKRGRVKFCVNCL